MLSYIGWVPTANGRLSFRHLGETKNSACRYINFLDANGERVVFAVQRRDLSDLLFAFFTQFFKGRTGLFHFVASCHTTSQKLGDLDALSGHVYIFKSPQTWNKAFPSRVYAIIDGVNKFDCQNRHELLAEAKRLVESAADISVQFSLWRDGEIEFDDPRFKSQALLDNSSKYATKTGVPFKKWIADQAYFFIRDITHVHQHHSPKVDTILLLQESKGDDSAWRDHILYSLHHYLIRVRRSARLQDLYRALGILGYAKAFEGVCHVRKAAAALPAFQGEAIRSSLVSRIEEKQAISSAKSERKNRALTISLGFRTIFFTIYVGVLTIAATIMVPYAEAHKDFIDKIGDTIIKELPIIVLMFVFVGLATWVLTSPSHFNDEFYHKNTLYRKDFVTLSLFHRRSIGAISTFLSALLVLLTLWIAWRF